MVFKLCSVESWGSTGDHRGPSEQFRLQWSSLGGSMAPLPHQFGSMSAFRIGVGAPRQK